MKKVISVSVDEFNHKKVVDKGINVSDICNRAIQAQSGAIDDDPQKRECQLCGKIGGEMYWLCPNEIWVCPNCDRNEIRKIKIGLIARR